MAALPPVPGVFRLRLQSTVGVVPLSGVHLFFQYTGPAPTTAQLGTLGTAVQTALTTNIVPLTGASVVYKNIELIDLSSATGAVSNTPINLPGTRTGGPLPASSCALFVGKINRRYRGGKPRGYWPLGTDSDLNGTTQWASAASTAFQNGMNAFIAAVRSAPWSGATIPSQCNVSYYSGFHSYQKNPPSGRWYNVSNVRPAGTIVPDPIAAFAYSLNPTLGSQRRHLQA